MKTLSSFSTTTPGTVSYLYRCARMRTAHLKQRHTQATGEPVGTQGKALIVFKRLHVVLSAISPWALTCSTKRAFHRRNASMPHNAAFRASRQQIGAVVSEGQFLRIFQPTPTVST